MGEIGCPIRYPSIEDIIRTNRYHLERAGQRYVGTDNLKERGSLEWVLEAIQYPLFGVERYPGLVEKAAQITWTIIRGHVFWDGNKRTGMSVLHTFLRMNGYRLRVTNDEIVGIALRLAGVDPGERYSLDEFIQWLRERIVLDRV